MKRRLRVLFASSLLCLMTACSLPLKMVPELEPDAGQTRILSTFSWRQLIPQHWLESVGDLSLVSIKAVDQNTTVVLRRHGMLALDVTITGRQMAVPLGGSEPVDSDFFDSVVFDANLGFDLSLDGFPVELLMPAQVAAIIESQVSPPGIGHLLLDFFGVFLTQGQSIVNGFQAQYLQALEVVEEIRSAGLYIDAESSAIRWRLYLRAPELQLNAIGKLLLVVQVDDEQHRLVHCLTRYVSLCGQNATVAGPINSKS